MNNELNMVIYDKFYGEAERRGLVWILSAWLLKEGMITEEQDEYDGGEEAFSRDWPHSDAVRKVLMYELQIFTYRRMNGGWGEVIDYFHHERNRFSNEYREATGYQIDTKQEDLIW